MKKLLVVFVVITAILLAAIPQSSAQTMYACVNTKNGAMRYVGTTPTSCGKGEVLISWNQMGPAGPAGPAGPPGPVDLTKLQGSPCTAHDGSKSTVQLVITAADGTVSIKCPSLSDKVVFVSSTQFPDANFGGVPGADAQCQALANKAGLSGVYKAWLSDSTHSPSTTFTQLSSSYNYIRTDLAVVAQGWSGLTSGSLQNPINLDENGKRLNGLNGDNLVFSSTTTSGTLVTTSSIQPNPKDLKPVTSSDCLDWTYNAPNDQIFDSVGNADVTTYEWTEVGSNPSSADAYLCNSSFYIYCFEQ